MKNAIGFLALILALASGQTCDIKTGIACAKDIEPCIATCKTGLAACAKCLAGSWGGCCPCVKKAIPKLPLACPSDGQVPTSTTTLSAKITNAPRDTHAVSPIIDTDKCTETYEPCSVGGIALGPCCSGADQCTANCGRGAYCCSPNTSTPIVDSEDSWVSQGIQTDNSKPTTLNEVTSEVQTLKVAPPTTLNEVTSEVQTLKVAPPCHFIESDGSCNESNNADSCGMDWEKPGTCTAVGFPVCCQVNLLEFWYKAGQKCSELHPGSQPFRPCGTTANVSVAHA